MASRYHSIISDTGCVRCTHLGGGAGSDSEESGLTDDGSHFCGRLMGCGGGRWVCGDK